MRDVDVNEIATRVRQAVQDVNFHTPPPVLVQLNQYLQHEPSAAGRQAMRDIVDNRSIASARRVPMCQDTGMAIVFVELGQDAHLVGGDFARPSTRRCDRVTVRDSAQVGRGGAAVRAAQHGDNTPAVVHVDIVPGEGVRLIVACKGFGAENMSWARVLTPAEGIEGVKREVVRCVEEAGPNACPPVVVGVGLGGTLELAALLAKKALMRETGQRNPDRRYAALELELLDLVNATGIGPQGWGGLNTALDVRVEFYATHIAAIPIAVNLDCHLQRHMKIDL